MDLGLSGLVSNLDWRSLVDQLAEVERTPQKRLLQEQDALEARNNAYGSILTQLKVLQSRVNALKSPELFQGRSATSSNTANATATVSAAAVPATYRFEFTQLATPSRQVGASGIGSALHDSADVSGLVLSNTGFVAPISAGTFHVNGATISIETSDSLGEVFDKIHAATQGEVTATYDPVEDRIRLSGTGPLVLGSVADTSNFLKVARLHNNGTSEISSSGSLGSVQSSRSLAEANLATPLDFGESGTGEFRINGVSFQFTAEDTLQGVLDRINESAAGVIASYDPQSDRLLLENKKTGDLGISLEDTSGNFLAATGLKSGILERGNDLLYSINGGQQIRSQSNTLDETSSGISGLTVTAREANSSATITVAADTSAARSAITGFIEAYNKAQSLIASQTASSTGSDGKVSTNVLTAESDAENIAVSLRRLTYSSLGGLGGTLKHLEALGIKSNSNDDTLVLEDPSKLDDALSNRLTEVRDFWTHSTSGLAVQLGNYLEKTAGESGTLTSKQDLLTRQASDINVQIADLERIVQTNRARMLESFVAMEEAQAKINQQMQFLLQRFPSS